MATYRVHSDNAQGQLGVSRKAQPEQMFSASPPQQVT
jgi:hypothetical protein